MRYILTTFFCIALLLGTRAQSDTSLIGKMVVVKLLSGGEQQGTLTEDDGREITIQTTDRGKMIIPKYQVKSIQPLYQKKSDRQDYVEQNKYGSHYQLFSNAISPGEGDVALRMPGMMAFLVDVSFSDQFAVSFGSVWFAAYGITGTYRKKLSEDHHFGFSVGFGSAIARFGRNSNFGDYSGFLAKSCYTLGTSEKNFSIGIGYLSNFSGEIGSVLFHTGGLVRLNRKIYLTTEAMILPRYSAGQGGWAMRLKTKKENAWDVGIHFVVYENEYHTYTPSGQIVVEKSLEGFGFPYIGFMHKF